MDIYFYLFIQNILFGQQYPQIFDTHIVGFTGSLQQTIPNSQKEVSGSDPQSWSGVGHVSVEELEVVEELVELEEVVSEVELVVSEDVEELVESDEDEVVSSTPPLDVVEEDPPEPPSSPPLLSEVDSTNTLAQPNIIKQPTINTYTFFISFSFIL